MSDPWQERTKELIGYFTLGQNGEPDAVVMDKTHPAVQFLVEQAKARWKMLMAIYKKEVLDGHDA